MRDWSWKVWMNLTFALLGLTGGVLALVLSEPLWIVVPALAFVLLSFSLPLSRWGWPGLFLTFGLIFAVTGSILWSVGSIGEDVVEELEKDNDSDGRVDEDPPGDADGSASDPTKADGAAELQDHADDDSDGRVDEDPPEPPGARSVARGVGTIGTAFAFMGLLLIALFGYFAWAREGRTKTPVPAPGPSAPTSPDAPEPPAPGDPAGPARLRRG